MFTSKHLGTIVLGLTLAASAWADTGGASREKEKAAARPPAADPAMRAYVDPETGRLVDRPVTQQQKRDAARNAPLQDAAKVEKIERPNGTRQYKLNGQAEEALVATVRPDGSLEYRCSEHGVAVGQPHDFGREVRDDR